MTVCFGFGWNKEDGAGVSELKKESISSKANYIEIILEININMFCKNVNNKIRQMSIQLFFLKLKLVYYY